MKDDLITLKQYYTAAARQVPDDSPCKQTLDHKFRHSLEVLRQGNAILAHTPELLERGETFRNLAQKALLFHDVGRFEENVRIFNARRNGTEITAMSDTYDHGVIGYELMQDRPPYNDMRILFAIRWHGKNMEEIYASAMYRQIKDSPLYGDIMRILFLVRDADKLANLYAAKEQDRLRRDLFYTQLPDTILNAPLSAEVKAQFANGKTVLSSTLHSFADRILQLLSWIYDFNYPATEEIFKQNKYAEFLLDLLSQYHHNPQDLQQISASLAAKINR